MITIPVKVKDRLICGIKKFQPIIARAKDKDINESDTVTIVTDIFESIFGYEKISEITSELAIKKTFCDLAVKLDGIIRLLIEVKAAGIDLKEQHMQQAVNYGSNSGLDWVILTNGVKWKVYKITFAKPIDTELVYEFDFSHLSTKKQSDLEMLYYLTREAMGKSSKNSLEDLHTQKMLVNKFVVGQILLSEPIANVVRKILKGMSADAKVTNEEIQQLIEDEIVKREVLDGEKATEAKKRVHKALMPPKPKHPAELPLTKE
ncbi:MAG: type I restriction enzyme HsdR N-terminal domain-containing protein [Clostridiaceae bacterium]